MKAVIGTFLVAFMVYTSVFVVMSAIFGGNSDPIVLDKGMDAILMFGFVFSLGCSLIVSHFTV